MEGNMGLSMPSVGDVERGRRARLTDQKRPRLELLPRLPKSTSTCADAALTDTRPTAEQLLDFGLLEYVLARA